MFIGHLALGFAAKRAAPRTSLGALIAAPILLDLLWPIFLLLGWETVRIEPGNTAVTPLSFTSYPISHSLLMSAVWGALFALLHWLVARDRAAAIVIALLVVSHWVLDAIAHRPDLPLAPGIPLRVGLGLWSSLAGTVLVESTMFAAGVAIYLRVTIARDRTGRYATWAFIAFLAAAYLGNIAGPPPPDERSLAVFALSLWLVPLWAWWIDRHREPRLPPR